MLKAVFEELDSWVCADNVERSLEGTLQLRPCEIRVLGQSALLELGVKLALAATQDVDVYATYQHPIEVRFRELLAAHNLVLDSLGHEVWMPPETEYALLHQGRFVTAKVALPEYVLVSKAARAPHKNRALITEYLAGGASPLFLELVERHAVDLEVFL